MLEVRQLLEFRIVHPDPSVKENIILTFRNETEMDKWLPYLNKFEDFLVQEAIKLKKK